VFVEVPVDRFDQMAGQALASEETDERNARFILIEEPEVDAARVAAHVEWVLDYLAECTYVDHRLSVAGFDVLDAACASGIALGMVYRAVERESQVVVELDQQACQDAIAWAVVADLPPWVGERYRRLAQGLGQS
jgi:hypothetical protein